MSEPRGADEPIEAYLDQLMRTLTGSAREIRHTLTEIEAHLYDSVADLQSQGLGLADAQAAAIRQLGPVDGIVDAPRLRDRLTSARLHRLMLAVLVVGGIGGIAVAAGGAIAWAVRALWGNRAIATPFPTGSYSAADCARWLAGYPASRTCTAAMAADHAADFLLASLACGILGTVTLGVFVVLRRRWSTDAVLAALPRSTEDIVGAGLAFAAMLVLVARGVDAALVLHGASVGQSVSLAIAAAAAAGYFAVRAVRHRPPLISPAGLAG